jgi:phenylalanyl-tRNA synthetase alpha chain
LKLDVRAIVEGLNLHEKKVLLALQELRESDITEIEKHTALDHAAVMRVSLSLAQKDLIRISGSMQPFLSITDEGRDYAERGLPERRMLEALAMQGSGTVDEVANRAQLTRDQAQISLGWLRRKSWADFIKKDDQTLLAITKTGEEALSQKFADEKLLMNLVEVGSIGVDELPEDLKSEYTILKERGLMSVERKIQLTLTLSELGNRVLELGFEMVGEVNQITHIFWLVEAGGMLDLGATMSPLPGIQYIQERPIPNSR